MIAHEDGPIAWLWNRLLDEIEVLRHGQPDRSPPQQEPSILLNHEAFSSLHIFNSAELPVKSAIYETIRFVFLTAVALAVNSSRPGLSDSGA
jgi:hypothetical protein